MHRLPLLRRRVRLNPPFTQPSEIDWGDRTKALLFAIVRHFEFELAVSPLDLMRRSFIVGRPALTSNPSAGAQLPLLIRPVLV